MAHRSFARRAVGRVAVLLVCVGCGPTISPEGHPPAVSRVFGIGARPEPPEPPPVPMAPEVPTAVAAPARPPGASIAAGRLRHALVIGNGRYPSEPLANPRNDASDVAKALRRLGFSVTLRIDAGHRAMEDAVRGFGRRLGADAVGLVYYAGHAVQHEGENYLIPVDAVDAVDAPEQLRYKTVNASYVLDTMEAAGNELNIVVLDACRNNPFRGFSRGLQRGLARMPDAPGALIAFSTSPGKTAADGTGRNSPYTLHLLREIERPGLTIEAMLKRVMRGVMTETAGKQRPWYQTSMADEFYFVPPTPP